MAQSRRQPPALTPEDREQQLIALAEDLAEKKLRDGTASPQIIVHYLKLATAKADLEVEKLKKETELLETKNQVIKSQEHAEQLYQEAIDAIARYKGQYEDYD